MKVGRVFGNIGVTIAQHDATIRLSKLGYAASALDILSDEPT